jgi:hypothetical protein
VVGAESVIFVLFLHFFCKLFGHKFVFLRFKFFHSGFDLHAHFCFDFVEHGFLLRDQVLALFDLLLVVLQVLRGTFIRVPA